MKEFKNDLLLRTLNGKQVERPPVWLMRQAGRILPQYRKVRSSLSGFIELVTTPELVAEVTIQPVDELDVDAAIIFSDILVIPEAMGLPYEMIEKKGPYFPKTIHTYSDVAALDSGTSAADRLSYVYEGIGITVDNLDSRVPLIGFAGAPFTLFCYMLEGHGSKTFSKAKRMLYQNPDLSHKLLRKITDTTIAYLHNKIKAGVDAVQVFDSWAGVLSRETYASFCIPYISEIIDALKEKVPTIVFSKGAWFSLNEIDEIDCSAIGLDWNIDPEYARSICRKGRIFQGNLDPCMLYAKHEVIESKTLNMINLYENNHIVNLGHGVYPDTPLEGVKCFVNAVKSYRYV